MHYHGFCEVTGSVTRLGLAVGVRAAGGRGYRNRVNADREFS